MKKILLLLACSYAMTSWAQSGTCGTNVRWQLKQDTLIISGEGEMTNFGNPDNNNSQTPSWMLYKNKIT